VLFFIGGMLGLIGLAATFSKQSYYSISLLGFPIKEGELERQATFWNGIVLITIGLVLVGIGLRKLIVRRQKYLRLRKMRNNLLSHSI
jgi:hypothetical protein